MWKSTPFSTRSQLRVPIIQAGMAGATSPELVAAVSVSGGLGTIGAGYDTPQKLVETIKSVKRLTDAPFSVNVFVPENVSFQTSDVQQMNTYLQPYLNRYGLDASQPQAHSEKQFQELIDIIIQLGVPICSFTFGIPSPTTIQQLKENDIVVIGSATSVEEAIQIERAGMDVVVAQGSEAGGHRGTFNDTKTPVNIGTMALVPQIVDHVTIPVIAAGGIMDGRGIAAALMLGASGVQMGTAFLTTTESGANVVHRNALMHNVETSTTMTKMYSGKWARGIENQFIHDMHAQQVTPLPYPIQNDLTKALRQQAIEHKDESVTHLWAGQGLRLTREMAVSQLMTTLEYETDFTFRRYLNTSE